MNYWVIIFHHQRINIAQCFIESTDYLGCVIRGGGGGVAREYWSPGQAQTPRVQSYTRPPRSVVCKTHYESLTLLYWYSSHWPAHSDGLTLLDPGAAEVPDILPHTGAGHEEQRARPIVTKIGVSVIWNVIWNTSEKTQASTDRSGWVCTPPRWDSSWCPGDRGREREGGVCSQGSLQCCTDCSTGSGLGQKEMRGQHGVTSLTWADVQYDEEEKSELLQNVHFYSNLL